MQIQRNASVEMAPMKNETVLFNPDNNKFCVLNVTAALLWEQLATPQTEAELLAALQDNFSDVDTAAASIDVQRVLQELLAVECVVSVD